MPGCHDLGDLEEANIVSELLGILRELMVNVELTRDGHITRVGEKKVLLKHSRR